MHIHDHCAYPLAWHALALMSVAVFALERQNQQETG